jgi:predicted transcriptional regulator
MREKGKGIKTIARALGVSKNTVRKYLRSSDPPKFKSREWKKGDSFREKIRDMLKQGYIGTRIYEELLGMSYEGSFSGVHRYLHECKQAEVASQLSTTRVENSPDRTRQIYILKNLKNRHIGVGEKVHECIQRSLNNIRRGIPLFPVDQIVSITLDQMRSEFRS